MRHLLAILLLSSGSALAEQAADEKLPEGPGLAAKYPGDRGLGKDPAVIFAESFEDGDKAALLKRWDEPNDKDGKPLELVEGGPEGGGKKCLQVTATLGQDTGGSLWKMLPRGAERAFARFYVKFAKEAEYIHHFVWMGGLNPPTRWPQPKAGERPKGDDRFSVGIEPWGERGKAPKPGNWNFYVYWHEMKVSADGKYWGNGIKPAEPQPAPRERWQCVEFMIRMNKPGERDGELALWLDGKLVVHVKKGTPREKWTGLGFQTLKEGGEPFEGFDWRKTPDLKISNFWLEHYVTENAAKQNGVKDPNPVNRVWFDDVVVAEKYIGPIHRK